MTISARDDLFHRRTDDPYWNESGWFSFHVPERSIDGAIYMHHRPNRAYVWAGLLLWDATGREIHDCLWHDFAPQHLPLDAQVPLESKVFEFETPGGLTVRNPVPLKRYEFTYRSTGCQADLVYEPFMEPYGAPLAGEWSEWSAGHYDHAGRMQGTILLDEERIEVNSLGVGDRSWGPHRVRGLTRGSLSWGLVSEDHGFHAQALTGFSPADDPLFGTTEPIRGGYYRRDGRTAALIAGEHKLQRADDETPMSVEVSGTDDLGRTFRATGRCVNVLNFPPFGSQIFWRWCLTDWQLDGAQAWGEELDLFDGLVHRQMARRFAGQR